MSLWHTTELLETTILSLQTDRRTADRWLGQDGNNKIPLNFNRQGYKYIIKYYAVNLYIYTGVTVSVCYMCESVYIPLYTQ